MFRAISCVATLCLLAACGGDDQDPACSYADVGSMTVVATSDMSTEPTAEVHYMGHGHVAQVAAGTGGYLWINVPETGDAGIYIQSEGAVEAFFHEGQETNLGEPSVHPDCGDVFPVYYEIPNMAAGTWHIQLKEATEASEVWIMAIPKTADDSHSDHDHHHH